MTDTTSRQGAGATVATAPVTVEQAAASLGVSASTVRRRIRDGSLRAEEARRPQGAVWLVHLPADATTGADRAPPAASAVATAPASAAGDQMIHYTRTLLEPLVAALERSHDRVGQLERENGQLVERLAAAREQLEALKTLRTHVASNLTAHADEPTAEPSDPPSPPVPAPIPPSPNGSRGWWRRWLAW